MKWRLLRWQLIKWRFLRWCCWWTFSSGHWCGCGWWNEGFLGCCWWNGGFWGGCCWWNWWHWWGLHLKNVGFCGGCCWWNSGIDEEVGGWFEVVSGTWLDEEGSWIAEKVVTKVVGGWFEVVSGTWLDEEGGWISERPKPPFCLGSDTETETENWPKILADTETNRNHKILNWKASHQGFWKKFSCHVNYQNVYSVYH